MKEVFLLKKWIKKLLARIHNFMLDGKDPKWIYTLSMSDNEGSAIDKAVEAKIAQYDKK